jgi:protein involved in polysaccharide export with SLBB domain
MNSIKSMMGGMLIALVLSLFAGCATSGSNAEFEPVPTASTNSGHTAVAPPSPARSVFNVGDLVIVIFSGLDKVIPAHEERVKEDGTITLPQIGAVKAEGRTPGELQKEIRSRYVDGRLYQPDLNVTVKGQERFFFVKGEVSRASNYVWSEGMTVLKAIAMAGDFNDFANRKRVTVTRVDGRQFTVDCKKAQGNPPLDLPVYPGDTIHVPKTPW